MTHPEPLSIAKSTLLRWMLVPMVIGALFALFAHFFLPAVLQGVTHDVGKDVPAPEQLLMEHVYPYVYLLSILTVVPWAWAYLSRTEKSLRWAFRLLVAALSLQWFMLAILMFSAVSPAIKLCATYGQFPWSSN